MKPKIGMIARTEENQKGTSYVGVMERYRTMLIDFDAFPGIILPYQKEDCVKTRLSELKSISMEDRRQFLKELEQYDGFLFPGGGKMLPLDFLVLEYARKNNVPVLGICLGMQELSVHLDNIHLEAIESEDLHHQEGQTYVHEVILEENSKLYQLIGKKSIQVNSLHRKKVIDLVRGTVSAKAPDGTIEAMEDKTLDFYVGVQWHPEIIYHTDENSRRLLESFIHASKTYQERKNREGEKIWV